MSFIIRIAIMAAIILGIVQLYNSPIYRPQLEETWRQILTRFNQIEEEINRQVGYGVVSNLSPKSVAVTVPKSRSLDWQAVGAMGSLILGGSRPVKVEVDYTPSSKPADADLETLKETVKKYSGTGVTVSLDSGNLAAAASYSLQDVVALTKNNRSCYSSSGQVCLYFLFLPGKLESSSALGASFTSTAAVLLTDQFKNGANPLVSRNRIAQATITHELGHLFGLVNLGYRSTRPHEDPDHPGHSSNSKSVMHWAVEDLTISSILSGGPATSFDSDDEADLAAIKGGQ